ncbi:MAG: hypothetical protein IJY74_07330, partial [Oscillospiraceae bacterium]|nr:hypothetical protein [Oscillospiraceae bacterium]
MARKNYNEPQIIQNRNGTAGIRFQTVIKRVALAFAIIIGIVALYFSLLPAMADVNGEVREYDGNVYFDNSLSQYDDVQISTDNGANWVSMTKTDKFTRGDIYEYAVSSGTTVMFRGVDSGIVHDTVVNYHINSASREWGYDYNNFSWTSAGMTVGQGNDCYFAPPKLMEYKYGGYAALSSGGIKAVRQFIYHQGDTSDVNSGVDAGISAKPEASTGGERKVYSALFEGDVQGFENATLSTDQKSSGGSSIFSSAKTTVAEQLRLPLSDICEKGATYNVSLDFFSVNGTKGAVYLYDGDTKVGTAPLFNNDGLTANTWTNLSGTLVVPEDCEDPYLQIAANKWDCYVDDVIITTTNAFIMPNSAENRTFWDAEYDMNGYLGEAGTTNLLGDSSQTGYLSLLNNTTNDTLEGSYDKNG